MYYKKMAQVNCVCLTIIIVLLIKNSSQVDNNDVQFVCGRSKFLSKCGCSQETDQFEHIPLFNIDCSRLEFKKSPSQNILPLLMGHLDLSHNKIIHLNETVKLSSSTLYYLDMSYNKIKYISDNFFMNLTQLTHLNLGHNKLENVNKTIFNGLTKLKVLNLKWNKIKMLPDQFITSLKGLEDLSLSYNNLGGFIEENGLANYIPKTIKHIYLEHINLTSLEPFVLDEFVNLKKLSIAYNPLQELVYLNLNYLEYLDISGTNISNISVKSLMFPHLQVLKMNRLPYLTKIYDYTFYNLHELKELYMEHCISLEEMDPLSFGYINDNKTGTLKKFSVAHSGLTFLPNTFQDILKNADEIHLKGNLWHCDCKLGWLKHLKNNVKDFNILRCTSPESEANKKIQSITEELPCLQVKKIRQPAPYYKPLKKWLFPLIGALTIIVIILTAILIYMRPTPLNIFKIRHIAPESPYSPVTIHPNQAEHF